MSEDLLQKVFEKLVVMERSIKGLKTRFSRMEVRFDKKSNRGFAGIRIGGGSDQ